MCRNETSYARTAERRALRLLHDGHVRYMDGLGVPDARAPRTDAGNPVSVMASVTDTAQPMTGPRGTAVRRHGAVTSGHRYALWRSGRDHSGSVEPILRAGYPFWIEFGIGFNRSYKPHRKHASKHAFLSDYVIFTGYVFVINIQAKCI